ncbi:hypothetical protein FDP41_000721 [Naegleria fowleri]|uniref:Uncharacterized protein n=1 Tax=Naegleria fowleri TaxID=5763 RepID=A0A6A5CCM0_NAEFO|nr:uncharacterized protein FDP41_000721 [Naegleria fowleri]KAF0984822.1 hypothetical protein FDP41_000721 [Naegleria fowleri]
MKKRKIEVNSESYYLSSMIDFIKVELEKQNFEAVIDYLEQHLDCSKYSNHDEIIKEILFPIYSYFVRRILLPQKEHKRALHFMKRALRYCHSLDELWEFTCPMQECDDQSFLQVHNELLEHLIKTTCDLIVRHSGELFAKSKIDSSLSQQQPADGLPSSQSSSSSSGTTFTDWEYALFKTEWLEIKDDQKPAFYPSSCHHLLDPIRGYSATILMPSNDPKKALRKI